MTRSRRRGLKGEEGSALTEAAIIIPILLLVVYWSSAVTDVLVLKLKQAEATRFALWELTVFRDPTAINTDLQTRFADLKSPLAAPHNGYTGLLMYPRPADLSWNATINIAAAKVALNGNVSLPTNLPSILADAINTVINFLSSAVDGAVQSERFNVYVSGSVTVALTHAKHTGSIILNGGDFLGDHGGQDLGTPAPLTDLVIDPTLERPRPNPSQLVYDSWKAWPKPALYTTNRGTGPLVDPSVSPQSTYPVVESMVSQQVNQICFFGLNRLGFFNTLNNFMGTVLSSGLSQDVLGGDLPTFFATGPMDHALTDFSVHGIPGSRSFAAGPVTILPVSAPDAYYVPGGGLLTNRLGDMGSNNASVFSNDDYQGMSQGSDQSRYTVPYRINSKWWTANGGTQGSTFGSSVSTPGPNTVTTNNNYIKAYACRGHFFAGATKSQVTDHTKRYLGACPN